MQGAAGPLRPEPMMLRAARTGSAEQCRVRAPGWWRRLVTVVLLTHDCAQWLPRTLDHLQTLGVPVIAVDNGSTDGTAGILQSRNLERVLLLDRNHGAAGRNFGVAVASTPYVVFADDDSWYEVGGLAGAVGFMDDHPQLALVGARVVVGGRQELDPVSAELSCSPLPDRAGIPGPVLLGFQAGAVLVRRSAYREVGGFDPRFFIGGEEETLAIPLAQHGWQMRYLPQLVVHHYPSRANTERMRSYRVRNTIMNAWLHRPLLVALRWTWFITMTTPSRRQMCWGLLMALVQLPWILSRRSVVDRRLGAMWTLLDDRRRNAMQHRRRPGR